ncbi:MAG: glutamine-hydrolyzing carbamoyl-phosphate synthase small subunit [Balneolales bacterium]|nr:glutamine-hydrolyzing carbamoyl-phosphate synthase small subunit [Balneolales bacterium]
MQERKRAIIALSDGTVETGYAIGYQGTTGGELCFNTSMYGYQEIFTDPSYYGQLMMMTYPHIGNYGVSSRDDEARKVMVAGVIVRAFSWDYSNTMADGDLHTYLRKNKIVGITGVDTRKLVRHIREKGVMNAVISSEELDADVLVQKAKDWVPMAGLELASKVTRSEAQTISPEKHAFRVAAFDYGIKQNIINNFTQRGCALRVFPAKTPFEQVLEWNPDGFFFSNGPGDPNPMEYAVEAVNKAKATGKPIFGICLGHQLLALSEGITVDKMFVGHRGANHPVRNELTRLVEITTQNHGFAIKPESVSSDVATISHVNLNDGTVEGLHFKNFNGFSVQYHPEASPGPHDSAYLFDEFIERIREVKA